ncbi:MAG: glutathione S-transferase [Candidatus Endobugula sp.]|jgi:glutathione S-transferase
MTITLYELSAANRNVRFSPHCWKSRLALEHKQLSYETEAVWFTEKDKIALSNQPLLPMMTDTDAKGTLIINDSWKIALYLDKKYPDAPSLFADDNVQEKADVMNQWVDTELAQFIRPAILMDIFALIAKQDRDYFRSSREAKIGCSLEEFSANPEQKVVQMGQALEPIRITLNEQPYLGGTEPDYRDICLLSTFLWVACVSKIEFLAKKDVIYRWYQHMLNHYKAVIPAELVAT